MPDNALVLLPIWDISNGTPLTLCFQGVRPARNIIIAFNKNESREDPIYKRGLPVPFEGSLNVSISELRGAL
jgi:hypothetical protein